MLQINTSSPPGTVADGPAQLQQDLLALHLSSLLLLPQPVQYLPHSLQQQWQQ
jgi:hypothetical protein